MKLTFGSPRKSIGEWTDKERKDYNKFMFPFLQCYPENAITYERECLKLAAELHKNYE